MSAYTAIKLDANVCSFKDIHVEVIGDPDYTLVIYCPRTYKVICPHGLMCKNPSCILIHPFKHNELMYCVHNDNVLDAEHDTDLCPYLHNIDFVAMYFWNTFKNIYAIHSDHFCVTEIELNRVRKRMDDIYELFTLMNSIQKINNVIINVQEYYNNIRIHNCKEIASSKFFNLMSNYFNVSHNFYKLIIKNSKIKDHIINELWNYEQFRNYIISNNHIINKVMNKYINVHGLIQSMSDIQKNDELYIIGLIRILPEYLNKAETSIRDVIKYTRKIIKPYITDMEVEYYTEN